MVMAEKDVTFETREDASNRKKLGKAGENKGEVNNNLDKQENEPDDDNSGSDDDESDSDFRVKEKPKKKEDTVIIELPNDILSNSEVCAMLDRTATISGKALGIVSSYLKSGKVDGKEADLSKFNLSRPSLEKQSE